MRRSGWRLNNVSGNEPPQLTIKVSVVARVTNAFRERASSGARDLHEVRIRVDLVEQRQETFRFGQQPVVHVRLELQQGVVDPQAIVFYAPLEQDEVALLPGQ